MNQALFAKTLTRRPRTTILSERLRPRVAAITRLVSQHPSDTSAPLSPPGRPRHAPHLRQRRASGRTEHWRREHRTGTGTGGERAEVVEVERAVWVCSMMSGMCNGRVGWISGQVFE